MIVEIDQSGKLEQLNTPTAVAYSDDRGGVVWVWPAIKRKIAIKLKKRFRDRTLLWPVIFAVVIFLLISDLTQDVVLMIDEEYPGKRTIITKMLEALLNGKHENPWHGSIRFGRIGKSSSAHRLAWQVHRFKNKQGKKSLNENDILKLLL